jgi:hypothetical protein
VNHDNRARFSRNIARRQAGVAQGVRRESAALLDREGNAVERFAPVKKPQDLAKDIEALL